MERRGIEGRRDSPGYNPILPRFELNNFTALSPRGEDNILSSRLREAAHLIAKTASGQLPRGQAVESMGNTRPQDLSRRPALMIARIVSRSLFDVPALFDVPVNNFGQRFRRADRKRMLHHPGALFARAPSALKHSGHRTVNAQQTENQGSNV